MSTKLLIADEPTTALDVLVQKEIMQLIKQLQKETKMGMVVYLARFGSCGFYSRSNSGNASREIVEQGETEKLFSAPEHPYTKGLLNARPPSDKRLKELPTLSHFIDGNFTFAMLKMRRNEKND